MQKITDYLLGLGLKHQEAQVYQGFLDLGAGTVKDAAEHLAINRIVVHTHVETLIQKGLLTETRNGGRRQIVAEPPDHLKYLLEKKVEEAESWQKRFPEILNVFHSSYPRRKKEEDVELKFYQGKQGVELVYDQILKAENVYSFADLEKYYEVFPNTQDVWKNALEKNPQREEWDILVDSPLARRIAQEPFERYHVKFLPKGIVFKNFDFVDYVIFDEKVAIIKLSMEHPTATLLDSQDIAMSLMALHKTIWNLILSDEVPKKK